MTEQEQTKQMLKTLCDKFQCSAIDRSYMAKSCRQCEDIVKALHEAGYGNISGYKAGIEQLKSAFKQLETNAEILAWGVRDLNHENYELTKKVKQAKIDVLNKVKERLDSAPNGWAYTTYIDELIEEVENEQKD